MDLEPSRVLTVSCHHFIFTTRQWPDGGAVGSISPQAQFLLFCRLGLGTTEEVFSMCDYSLKPLTHHDALEFSDGQIVLLTELFEHQKATVLQLPTQSVTAAEVKSQERVAYIG